MFGDEKFLLDYDNEAHSLDSPHEYAQSNRISENPFFLATNASIFDRNPFKEFTTNRLNEILAGKNYKEIVTLKDEALKF